MKLKLVYITAALLILTSNEIINAQIFEKPEIDAHLILQLESFDGDEMSPFAGYETPVSRFSIRHASIEASGKAGNKFEYNVEAGTATCLAGGQFTLMDASLFYYIFPYLKVGFAKGEILRGFMFSQDCGSLLTGEKTRFAKTFAPCHPTGGIIELDYNFENNFGLLLQLAYLNGKETNNIQEEYDQNVGIVIRTPVKGLEFAGYFNRIKANFGTGPAPEYKLINGEGNRMGFGAGFERKNFSLKSEYYMLKGYYNNPFSGTLYKDASHTQYINSEDIEMGAFYIESGYSFTTELKNLQSVQPYLRYQTWDKAVNAYGDHQYSYLTMGINFWLDKKEEIFFRVDFEKPIDAPEGIQKDASLLILRFQKGF